MCGHKTWRTTGHINIPCTPNIQARAVRRKQASLHYVAAAMGRWFRFRHLVLACVAQLCLRQLRSLRHRETKAQEKPCLAATGGMRRVEQILRHLPFRHGGGLGVGQFHLAVFDFFQGDFSSPVRLEAGRPFISPPTPPPHARGKCRCFQV